MMAVVVAVLAVLVALVVDLVVELVALELHILVLSTLAVAVVLQNLQLLLELHLMVVEQVDI
jgi:hypothetical protein